MRIYFRRYWTVKCKIIHHGKWGFVVFHSGFWIWSFSHVNLLISQAWLLVVVVACRTPVWTGLNCLLAWEFSHTSCFRAPFLVPSFLVPNVTFRYLKPDKKNKKMKAKSKSLSSPFCLFILVSWERKICLKPKDLRGRIQNVEMAWILMSVDWHYKPALNAILHELSKKMAMNNTDLNYVHV